MEKVGNILFIREEKPQQCDDCGKIAELRPYGKNGACICFECGEKDPEMTKQMCIKHIEKLIGPSNDKG